MSVMEPPASDASPTPRRDRARRQRVARRRGVVLLVALVVVMGLVGSYEYLSHGVGGPGHDVTIQVTSGESFSSVASKLESTGVISSTWALRVFDVIHGAPSPQPGFYTLPSNSTFQAVHDAFGSPPNTMALEVPAGFTIKEIEKRVASMASPSFSSDFRTALSGGSTRSPFEPSGSTNLEGLVGAGQYLVPPSMSAQALATSMVDRFVTQATLAGLTPTTTRFGLNSYELATVASVVEKEGYLVENMGRVSRVIENRLGASIPLQMDSTVLYALGQDGGPVSSATERIVSPYNTYLNRGLPPTPICTSSQAALVATMHPTVGSWLYFTLIDKTGKMGFSTTFAQQLANERLAQENGI